MSKYTLTYEKNKSQEIYIEKIGEENKESLYFSLEYDDARKLIREIVELQGTKNEDPEKRKEKRLKIKKYGCNNRILFTGQRGCGKTSVMRSLADYLSSRKKKKDNSENHPQDEKGHSYVVKFSCLPMVDPSHFDNNNNILLTIITSMFSEAKRKMNEDKDGGDTSYREELLKQFEKVFKSLDSIKSELSSYTLESLNRKSDAEDLKDKMKNLVDKYLTFQGYGNSDEARLILLIDDIDMSVSYAPEMLEQLRKYLELDNLIILMSANLGQLTNEMREKYSSAFQYTLKDSNQALSIDVEDLATKYLLKLFPTSRRINVERHTSQLLETDLIIKETGKKDIKDRFQKVILSLIWSKTRLLFIPKDSENTLHPIIPTNLRDLAQFLDMLTSLKDVGGRYKYKKDENKKEEKEESRLFAYRTDYEECEHNLQVFKNYVMKTWIPNHLNVQEELVFHNIPTDITEINKHLINSINIIGTNHKNDLMSRQVSLDIIERNAENVYIDRDIYTMVSPNDPKFVKANKISDIFNQPSNYSYGDLLLMIDKYETYFESEEHRKFTDAIKIYYSILLFETMFFKSKKVRFEKEGFAQLKEEDQVLPIQKLIGGTVYYPNYFEIITSKHFLQKGPSFDAKRAFYHKVDLKQNEKNENKFIVGDNYPLFSVLYYGDIRPDRYDTKHIYDTTFKTDADVGNIKYVTFDILSILSNMLNPWHTIERAKGALAAKGGGDEIGYLEYNDEDFFEWKKNCRIENGDTVTNSMLPFYSIDIMLQYLKYSISFDSFNTEDERDNDLVWKELDSNERTKLEELLMQIPDKDSKEKTLTDFLKPNFNFAELNEIKQENKEVLEKAITFYRSIYSLVYDSLKSKLDITNTYRDFVIALILQFIKGGDREKGQLIKNLHKFSTSSEITEHLYSVLYKDAYRENTVRLSVQNAVHSNAFVHYYYNKLWDNTKRMLDSVNVLVSDDNSAVMPAEVYGEIYKKAIECFVTKRQAETKTRQQKRKAGNKQAKNIVMKTTKNQKK